MKKHCLDLNCKPASEKNSDEKLPSIIRQNATYCVATYAYPTKVKRHFYCQNSLKTTPQRPQRANHTLHRRRAVCTRAQGQSAHATTPSAPAIVAAQTRPCAICASPRAVLNGGPLWRRPLSCGRFQTIRFGGRYMHLHVGVEQTPDHPLVLGLVL